MKLLTLIAVAAAALAAGPAPAPAPKEGAKAESAAPKDEPLDYTLLTHTVAIDTLRAGSHDPSGVNEYVFQATMYGLLNSSEERNKPFADRKKVTVELGTFGDTTIESLAVWRADEKAKDVKELGVEGNGIRELAARAMQEFKVQEAELCVMVELVMLERQKKWLVLKDDQVVAKTSYYPIPPTKFDTPIRTNQQLLITDDKGTNVKVGVRYEHPAAAAGK